MLMFAYGAMTIGPRFPADRTRYLSFHVSKRLRVLARRLSALEHPGRSVAARAHDSKWHTSAIRPHCSDHGSSRSIRRPTAIRLSSLEFWSLRDPQSIELTTPSLNFVLVNRVNACWLSA